MIRIRSMPALSASSTMIWITGLATPSGPPTEELLLERVGGRVLARAAPAAVMTAVVMVLGMALAVWQSCLCGSGVGRP